MTAEPGDRPPRERLPHAPSERYARGEGAGASTGAAPARPSAPAAVARRLTTAFVAAGVTALLLVLVGGVLAEVQGLIAIAVIGAALVGLAAAGAAVTAPDGAPAVIGRRQAEQAALGLTVGLIVASWLLTWGYARLEGGVLGPMDYLWTTFGAGLLVQAVLSVIAALWGAGAGPIRGSS